MSIRRKISQATLISLFCILSLPSMARSLDGNREGFVLQLGLGPTLTFDDGDQLDPININFKVGKGISDQILYHSVVESSYYDTDHGKKCFGFIGLGWSYYFQPNAPSVYLTAGLGYAYTDYPSEDHAPGRENGFGLSAGAGYEFVSHWSAEGSVVGAYVGSDGFMLTLGFSLRVMLY